jgi:hypothetical protein
MTAIATATARIPWHPPMIFEFVDHGISPRAAQLTLSSRHPKREHTDKEREAQMNREAVDRWRERQYDVYPDGRPNKNKQNKRVCCIVEYESYVLDGLVALGQIQENETGDAKIVGAALSEIIAEVLTPEAVAEALRARDRA